MIKLPYALLVLFVIQLSAAKTFGQNIFPNKVEGCETSQFCLDCGDPKADLEPKSFAKMIADINHTYNFKGGKGRVLFQVLVDPAGNGCVLSHTGPPATGMLQYIITQLNGCKWIPAIEKGKGTKSSINIMFSIEDDKISGSIQRVDLAAMNRDMNNPGTPDIYNKTYTYTNPTLNSYTITVWQKQNSKLPNDMSQTSVVDKQDQLWYSTFNGLVKFSGDAFFTIDPNDSQIAQATNVGAMAVDKDDNKWLSAKQAIYKFDNKKWEKLDSTKIGISGAYHIVPTDNGEVLFCDDKGLMIYKNGNWNLLNNKNVPQLPSNRVYYAYRDKQQRLWIGTFSGSIMIDAANKVTEFNKTDGVLKNICISGMAEDEQGNLYFDLYAYTQHERNSAAEGLAVLSPDGKWTHYNDQNSGLPADHLNSIMYDKFEHILWLGTNSAGLVRFDLKNSWEVYHNQNSKIPSVYIYNLSQDSKGNIYASTYYGMVRLSKN